MRDLVDGEEEVLVGGCAKDVGDGPELPGPEGSVVEHPGEEDLEGDDAEDDPFRERLGAAELGDLLPKDRSDVPCDGGGGGGGGIN